MTAASALKYVLSVTPAIAVAGTAFLYFAGYIYLDEYRSGFGIGFTSTETSTGEVIGLGYMVVLAAIIEGIQTYFLEVLAYLAGITAIGALIAYGLHREWYGFPAAARTVELFDQRFPGIIVAGCLCLLVIVGSYPAGHYAARREREHTIAQVKRGCCFTYRTSDGEVIRGMPLAEDHNRSWVLTTDAVVAVPLDRTKVDIRPEFAEQLRRDNNMATGSIQ